jgi:hypothetical protein
MRQGKGTSSLRTNVPSDVGRLDSDQQPPEPHPGGNRPDYRKGKPWNGLPILHFPFVTDGPFHFPEICRVSDLVPTARDRRRRTAPASERRRHTSLGSVSTRRRRSSGGSNGRPAELDDVTRITSDPEARAEVNPVLERLGVRIGRDDRGRARSNRTRAAVRNRVGGMEGRERWCQEWPGRKADSGIRGVPWCRCCR